DRADRGRGDDLAQVQALTADRLRRRVAEVRPLLPGGDAPRLRVEGNGVARLDVPEQRDVVAAERAEAVGDRPRGVWVPCDLRRVLREQGVDLRVQLVPHHEVRRGGRGGDDDGDDERGDEREPGAEGHGSRSTYPVPRTVWISRGSPPASVLRR